MLYALLCDDKPDALELRKATRGEHLAYLEGLGERLVFAGPFLDGAGAPEGSLVVLDVADEAEARAVAERDPYALAGLFETVRVRRWNWAVKNPAAV